MLAPLTQEEKKRIQKIFKELAKEAGSQTNLAKSLRLTKPSISQLISGRFLPSAHICLLIEAKYGRKKEELRPDIFMLT